MAVTAGTTYVASYFTSAGHYAATQNGLASAVTNGPLTALAGGGVYTYGSVEHLPHQHLPGVQLLGRRGLLAIALTGAPRGERSRVLKRIILIVASAAAAGLTACSSNTAAPAAAPASHKDMRRPRAGQLQRAVQRLDAQAWEGTCCHPGCCQLRGHDRGPARTEGRTEAGQAGHRLGCPAPDARLRRPDGGTGTSY